MDKIEVQRQMAMDEIQRERRRAVAEVGERLGKARRDLDETAESAMRSITLQTDQWDTALAELQQGMVNQSHAIVGLMARVEALENAGGIHSDAITQLLNRVAALEGGE